MRSDSCRLLCWSLLVLLSALTLACQSPDSPKESAAPAAKTLGPASHKQPAHRQVPRETSEKADDYLFFQCQQLAFNLYRQADSVRLYIEQRELQLQSLGGGIYTTQGVRLELLEGRANLDFNGRSQRDCKRL